MAEVVFKRLFCSVFVDMDTFKNKSYLVYWRGCSKIINFLYIQFKDLFFMIVVLIKFLV